MKIWGGSVFIWGSISGNGLRILSPIDGTLTAQKYLTILDSKVARAFKQFNEDFDYFQEDNDPKHGGPRGALITKEWFLNNPQIQRMEWPANSPDLNPIEHAWKMLQIELYKKPKRTKKNLYEMSEKIWLDIPTEKLWSLIDSMPDRIAAVIMAKGGNTKY